MFLRRLVEYSERLPAQPTLYSEAPVRYIVELDGSGKLLNPDPTDTADPSTPRTRFGQRRLMPQVHRTSGVRSLLLAGNSEYTLGLARERSRPERVAACHQAYMDQLDRCAAATKEPAVAAVLHFLRAEPLSELRLPDDWRRDATITFRVGGDFVVDLPAVQAFWTAENDPDADPDRPAPIMQCIVCGESRPVLHHLKGMIKGIPGGQKAGTAIISANAEAFESYGLAASLIAPTCARCGERFTLALNSLLRERTSHMVLGNAALVFWTREVSLFSLFTFLDDPQPGDVAALLQAFRKGGHPPSVDDAAFYAATLSASGGRAVLRDWIDTTIGEVKAHLASWFSRQRVVDAYGAEALPLGIYQLAAATVRDPRKDLAPPTPRALWRAALTGTPLPMDLLYQAVRRNRAERRMTYQRAALIKLVLCSRQPAGATTMEDTMAQLDLSNPSPAYRCGRLLAVIEEAQRLAVPGIKATVVDRFFGTASSAPASVFGRLLRGAQPHLGKLKRDRPGAYRAIQARLEEVQAGLAGFPRILTLEDQGLFALGYYHQRACDRAEAREAAARRRAASAAAEGGSPALPEIDAEEKGEGEG